jgi:ATP-dependent RNA helicase SUPV3L1/SUV3
MSGSWQGFRFTADPVRPVPRTKAVQAAAQKALAQEFEARAERLPCGQWRPRARLRRHRALARRSPSRVSPARIAAPRVILLADEQLTGPARDKVAARIERFVNHQVESLLKPLDDLKNAEDRCTGLAAASPSSSSRSLGVLNRRDIADDVKSLDQDARASLRKLGIRFGAYHIFMPALLKPAPAGLITLLWALKNDGKDKPGYGDVVNGAGRRPHLGRHRSGVRARPSTSSPASASLGKRAVRIDILERLADLIRPLLQWKPGTARAPKAPSTAAASW